MPKIMFLALYMWPEKNEVSIGRVIAVFLNSFTCEFLHALDHTSFGGFVRFLLYVDCNISSRLDFRYLLGL